MSVVAFDCACDDLTTTAQRLRSANVYPKIDSYCGIHVLKDLELGSDGLRAALDHPTVRILTGSGHGTAFAVGDIERPPILTMSLLSDQEVAGRIIHLLACDAGRALGPHLVDQGASFVGYTDLVLYDKPIIGIAIRCDCEIERVLLQGGTLADAAQSAREAYLAAARTIEPRSPQCAEMLRHNAAVLVQLGNGSVRLPSH
jgi:hypothetical protein